MIKILITEASGFIGGAFMRRVAPHHGVELCGVGQRLLEGLPTVIHCYVKRTARMVTASYRTINDARADLGIGIDRVVVQRQATTHIHRDNIRF